MLPRTRAPILALSCTLVFLLLGSGSVADEQVGDAASFEKELVRVSAISWGNRGRHGLAVLKALLEDHAGRPYVLARRADIEDLMLRLAFAASVKTPQPKDLVSGKLRSWRPQSGRLDIVYTPYTAQDLQAVDSFFQHPARFRGPATLEIEGGYQPKDMGQSPVILFGGDVHPGTGSSHLWRIGLGCGEYESGSSKVSLPATVHHVYGSVEQTVFKQDRSPMRCFSRYRIKVKVDDRRIVVHVNGRRLASFEKHEAIFGTFAFRAPMWKKVTFKGEIEPSWIQSKIDEAVQVQRVAFENTYRPRDHLPAWLLDTTVEPEALPAQDPLPTQIGVALQLPLIDFFRALDEGDATHAGRQIDVLATGGAPEVTCEYLRALVRFELGESRAALDHVERVIAHVPEFLPGVLLRCRLLQRLGRDSEASAAFEAAADRHGTAPDVYEAAVMAFLMAGRTEAAREFCDLAAGRRVASKRLALLGRALVKADRGPVFTETYENKSRHYHVVSDIDKKTCIQAAALLEEAYAAYRRQLSPVSEETDQRFRVYVFRGRAGFMAYLEDVSALMGKPAEKAAGLYSPLLKQLLIWNLPNRDEMLETVRHEGSHQYLDRLLLRPPIWLDEGLAVYHENARSVSGRLHFGRPHLDHLKLLREVGCVALGEFLRFTPRQFYAGGRGSYAQAWLFVHMLRSESGEFEEEFKTMIEAMCTRDGTEVTAALFPSARIPSLEKALRAHLHAAVFLSR